MAVINGTSGGETLDGTNTDDQIFGLGGIDTLNGLEGNDLLDGGEGADTMVGGLGNDFYRVDDAGDAITEFGGQGDDFVAARVSYALAAGASVETMSTDSDAGTNAINLTGNEFAQSIFGNAGNNILIGLGAADQLVGYGGNDVLIGGTGADVLKGGLGNDIYRVDDSVDIIIELTGEGDDTVSATASYVLVDGLSVETMSTTNQSSTAAINLVGNEIAQSIFGNAGNNLLIGAGGDDQLIGYEGNDILEGAAGFDVMRGNAGNDFYRVEDSLDQIFELVGEGDDTLSASVSYVLPDGLSVETMTAYDQSTTNALNLIGNELAQSIFGNAGNNLLNGGSGDDQLIGYEGNDILEGGAGFDVMRGNTGNDTYRVEDTLDQIFEFAGEGDDTILASTSFTLGAALSIETMTAYDQGTTNAFNLTGNELGQSISGNNGANVLDGGLGIDLLRGYGGADSFTFTTALGTGNVDIVADFNVADDTIRLGGAAGEPFAQLASGALAAASFVIGAAALNANDYLIYNSGTGALMYDADGNGAGAAVQFAVLSTGLSLTAADFFVSGSANTAPAITSGATANVTENSPVSTIVYQTQANDADGDRITYSLSGADAALLTIDANGAVRLISSPDFETRTTYNFNVVVSDSGISTSKAVTLSVIDQQEVATPIINETTANNNTSANAQFIDRNLLVVANNANLPNDDLPSATIQGSVSDNNDRDYYSITLQQGELLILDVDFTNGGLDSHIFVLSPSTVPLGDNDDQGVFDAGSTGIAMTHNTDSYFQFRAPAAGTYYFYIQSFGGTSAGDYKINVSIGPPASAALIFQEDVDALISGAEWNHNNLTYGFPQTANQYPSNIDEANPDEEFQPFTAAQQAATRQLLQLVANVSSLTFTELTGGVDHTSGAGSADLRYAMSTDDEVEAAHAYYPTNGGPTSAGGSSWYNTTSFNNPLKGNYGWMGILHETGHALGLEHGHEDAPTVSPGHDSLEYTVMTYRSYIGDPLVGGYSNEQFGYAQTLMMLDIGALQKMYGANFAFNSTDSVYTWSDTTGEMFINGAGQGAPGNGAGGTQNRVFLTIWDGDGTDTYDMSNYGGGVTIDLRPGEWSITSQVQLAGLGDGNTARGNVANALQFNDDARSLIENAVGGSGSDSLTANVATNRLTGNGGIDTFKWMSRADGADLGASADILADFVRGTDKIDLSGVDANSATEANDAFSFIGNSAFTSAAGQLRYQVEGAHLRIQGDTDGNGVSDFEIIVHNNTIFAATDFIL